VNGDVKEIARIWIFRGGEGIWKICGEGIDYDCICEKSDEGI
jgi:hypothetical protein